MSNYIEYEDTVAFHPGYYIEEIIDDMGLTQKDFANRLGILEKTLSKLINGKCKLTKEHAVCLSRMLGTSTQYWLNLQSAYDAIVVEHEAAGEIEQEREVLKEIGYVYFRDKFGLPDLSRKIDEQVKVAREFLGISSLCLLKKQDLAVSFRSSGNNINEANTIKANVMVQIATNEALKRDAKKFNKKRFMEVVEYALSLTSEHDTFYQKLYDAFLEAGVVLVILPNLSGSKINGATKKIGDSVMLMVSDRRLNSDTFWFTLFHEIGHIKNGDYGISFDGDAGEGEKLADKYAEDLLIPPEKYATFIEKRRFDSGSIKAFAKEISRDPGIILGRLQNDRYIGYTDPYLNTLRHKYKVSIVS